MKWFTILLTAMAFRSCGTLNLYICSGIWGPTRHLSLKITNSLLIFRLRKPLKHQPGWPATGFEPGTSRMRVSCVTTEPLRSVNILYYVYSNQNFSKLYIFIWVVMWLKRQGAWLRARRPGFDPWCRRVGDFLHSCVS